MNTDIRRVAELAGVSTATVSRVINNVGNVKASTREKVLKVIEAEGYIPNQSARDLSTKRTRIIALICPNLVNSFYLGMLDGVTIEAEREGEYSVSVFNTEERPEKEHEFIRIISKGNVAGVIISPVHGNDRISKGLIEAAEEAGTPFVFVDRFLTGNDFHIVTADNVKGSCEAVSTLIDEGHKDIACIGVNSDIAPLQERLEGYEMAHAQHNIPVKKEYIRVCGQTIDLAYEAMGSLMTMENRPTAVFTTNNFVTLGCLKYITEHGIRLGRDLSIIGFDDIRELQLVNFGLSVVEQHESEIGRRAMIMMMKRLKGEKVGNMRETVPTSLILRGSEKFDFKAI